MDFDDLDDAIADRIAEGGDVPDDLLDKAEKSHPKAQLDFAIPLCDRTEKIPISPEVAGAVKDRHSVTVRCYVFYGPGDTAEGFVSKMPGLPPWVEVVAHEWPGHGARKDETPAADFDELVEDAYDALAPTLEPMAVDGAHEGAPFVFVGHSVGNQLMVAVAKKLEIKLGVLPSAVVALDRAAPELPLVSEEGEALLGSNPQEFLKSFNSDVCNIGDANDAGAQAHLKTWISDLQALATTTQDQGSHIFDCDITVVKAGMSAHIDDLAKQGAKYRQISVKMHGASQQISVPVEAQVTTNKQLKEVLAGIFGADVTAVTLHDGAGEKNDRDLVSGDVTIKGIKAFKNTRHKWPHPVVIIGAGYRGVKTAAYYCKEGNDNIMCFDRHECCGGDAWLDAATKHSKIQTDFAGFNIWWGSNFVDSGDKGFGRPGYYTWYKRDDLLTSFQRMAEEYGALPHIRFKSDVTALEVVGKEDADDRYYKLTVTPLEEGKQPFEVKASVIYHYPSSYHQNRIVEYPGEDEFGGIIGYGMGASFPFHDPRINGAECAILGNGAFAVENVRSCIENGAKKVWLITRRKNLACPRLPCLFCHAGPLPTPADMLLNMFKPMYEAGGMGDPWDYWAVQPSKDRQTAHVQQSSRFGIGDVTFLCHYHGKLEYKVTTLKRLTKNTLHLENGEKLENVTGLVKALGLLGDFRCDKLHKITKRIGDCINGDWRRVMTLDATGMSAANFTTHSLGIGVQGFCRQWKYLHDNPSLVKRAASQGLWEMMPVHIQSKTQPDQPAYVTNVNYEMSAGMIWGSFFPEVGTLAAEDSLYKYCLCHDLHPVDKVLDEVIEDWNKYQKMFREQGSTKPDLEYPYSKAWYKGWHEEYSRRVGWPISVDGPSAAEKKKVVEICKYNQSVKDWRQIPDVIRSSALPSSAKLDRYVLAWASSAHAGRSKLTASAADSATDFDAEGYEAWSGWTSGQVAVEVVEDSKSDGLQHAPRSWEIITKVLEKAKATLPGKDKK